MAEQETREVDSESAQKSHSSVVKYIFIGLMVLVLLVVWWSQRTDPRLEGWTQDYEDASELAREQDRRILVFFSETPMNRDDRRMVDDILTHSDARVVLEYEDLVPVHLPIATHGELAAELGVAQTPAVALLTPEGEPISTRMGYMSVQQFVTEFLDSSASRAREALSRQ